MPTRTASRRVARLLGSVFLALLLLEGLLQLGAALLREPDPLPVAPDPAAYRILAVGDSWIYGAEAPRGSGFVDELARRLPDRVGRPVQLLNLGRNGANSAHAASRALETAPAFRPHLAVVLVGLNNGSNLQGVAELAQQARRPLLSGFLDRSRVAKALRIARENLSTRRLPEVVPMRTSGTDECIHGDFAFGTSADARPDVLCRGLPVAQAPLLDSEPGRAYRARFVEQTPPRVGDPAVDLAWDLLFAAARGDRAAADSAGARLLRLHRWDPADPDPPRARGDREVLARYALLRAARERQDWLAVRRHGGALLDVEPRGLLTDLGGAEALVLAGDWRRARALLISAHHRLPGLPDVQDLAIRFPAPARDGRVHDAIEWPSSESWLGREAVRREAEEGLYFSPDVAESMWRSWLADHPADDAVRADFAVWLAQQGREREAREAGSGLEGAARLRLDLALLSRGDPDAAVRAAEAALSAPAADRDALLAEQILLTLESAADCGLRPEAADRWYRLRGDAFGYARSLEGCLDRPAAAARLARLREAWGPLGSEADWAALVGAGHEPFRLLEEHLDLVREVVEQAGGRTLVLTYPNPDGGYGVLAPAVASWAETRPVLFVDLHRRFAERFDGSEWRRLLAPGGHCNADGYRVMAEEILAALPPEALR